MANLGQFGHFTFYSILISLLAYSVKINVDLSSKIQELHMECVPAVTRTSYSVRYQVGVKPPDGKEERGGEQDGIAEEITDERDESPENLLDSEHQNTISSSVDVPMEIISSESTSQLPVLQVSKEQSPQTACAQVSSQSVVDRDAETDTEKPSQVVNPVSQVIGGEMDYLQMNIMGTEFSDNMEFKNTATAYQSSGTDEHFQNEILEEEIVEEEWEEDGTMDGQSFQTLSVPSYEKSSEQILESSNGPFFTSVFCQGHSKYSRLCHFKNLCYSAFDDAFVFLHHDQSVYHNIQYRDKQEPFVQLTTVFDFQGHDLVVMDKLSSNFDPLSASFINGTSVLFYRFKSDNLQHVLHDDLLPLHQTLNFLGVAKDKSGKFSSHLVLMEGWEMGEYVDLYQAYSSHPIVTATDLRKMPYTCFESLYAGLSKETVWYHYGYNVPQSPLPNMTLTSSLVRDMTNYLNTQLEIPKEANIFMTDTIVLLSRKQNRRILNEMEIMLQVSMKFRKKVTVLSFETHSLKDMIHYATHADGVIGVHGALMSLSMFLPPKAFVVELFPYAINPLKYTPYKTLAELQGMGLVYRNWVNTNMTNTKGHPNWPKEFGGIGHLSSERQKEILAQQEVPDHLCCEDASWLYHAYQDTHVNMTELILIISSALEEVSQLKTNLISLVMFPSQVVNFECEELSPIARESDKPGSEYSLSWQPPRNLNDLSYGTVLYEIIVSFGNDNTDARSYKTKDTNYIIVLDRKVLYLKVWIRPVLDGIKYGQLFYKECKTLYM